MAQWSAPASRPDWTVLGRAGTATQDTSVRLDFDSLVPPSAAAHSWPCLEQLVVDVRCAVERANEAGVKPPTHVTLPADEYDELWRKCGKPYCITVFVPGVGVEVRRYPPRQAVQ